MAVDASSTPQPAPPPADTPSQPARLPAGYVRFGPHELGVGAEARCIVVLKPKSSGKVDKKEADGKSDAATTWKGAKPAEWEADISWNNREGIEEDEANDARIEEILFQLSPRGPNPGKSWEYAAKRARVHGTSQAEVEEVEGPEDTPGTSEVKAKIKFCSWAAPSQTTQGQGEATTADKADNSQPTDPNGGQGGGTTVHGFGTNGNTVTFPPGNTPTVKP